MTSVLITESPSGSVGRTRHPRPPHSRPRAPRPPPEPPSSPPRPRPRCGTPRRAPRVVPPGRRGSLRGTPRPNSLAIVSRFTPSRVRSPSITRSSRASARSSAREAGGASADAESTGPGPGPVSDRRRPRAVLVRRFRHGVHERLPLAHLPRPGDATIPVATDRRRRHSEPVPSLLASVPVHLVVRAPPPTMRRGCSPRQCSYPASRNDGAEMRRETSRRRPPRAVTDPLPACTTARAFPPLTWRSYTETWSGRAATVSRRDSRQSLGVRPGKLIKPRLHRRTPGHARTAAMAARDSSTVCARPAEARTSASKDCTPRLTRFTPRVTLRRNASPSNVPGSISMEILASGWTPKRWSSAARTRARRSGGTREGVPPPKKTVRSGGGAPATAAARREEGAREGALDLATQLVDVALHPAAHRVALDVVPHDGDGEVAVANTAGGRREGGGTRTSRARTRGGVPGLARGRAASGASSSPSRGGRRNEGARVLTETCEAARAGHRGETGSIRRKEAPASEASAKGTHATRK